MSTLKPALLAAALGVIPVSAAAQDVGATIYGHDGEPVGTAVEVDAQVVVIDTGTHRAPVPANLIFDGVKGKSVNATRRLVDEMMDERIAEADAERDAKLVPGAGVISVGGRAVGELAAVDLAADSIILQTPTGPLRLKKSQFAVNPQGELTVLYSREQIASAAARKPQSNGGAR